METLESLREQLKIIIEKIKRLEEIQEGEDVLKELENEPLYEGEISPEEEMELLYPKKVKQKKPKKVKPKGIMKSGKKFNVKKSVKIAFDKKGVDYKSLAKKIMAKLKPKYKPERVPYLVFIKQMWEAMGKEISWKEAVKEYRDAYYTNMDMAVPAKKRVTKKKNKV